MRHVGPTSFIYIKKKNKGEAYFCNQWSSVLFLIFFLLFLFSFTSLFDIRKSDRQNSSGEEAKCSTQ